VIFGGAFLLAPGFITDVFGIVLLLPPTRALVRRFIVRTVLGRTPAGRAAMFATRRAGGRGDRPPADVDSTAEEVAGPPRAAPPPRSAPHEINPDPPRLP